MSQNQKTEFAPKVAIIGRPNVGKSTLFNIITETRKAVVKNQSGVTRDIMIEPVDIWGKQFDLIDTGGITEAGDLFSRLIKEQVSEFLHSVDYIIAVMDGRAGLIPEDRDIIRVAKQTGKPFLLVINKVDSSQDEEMAKTDFYEFGVDIISAAFEQRRGIGQILEWIVDQIPEQEFTYDKGMKIAIVGKPNVGKSSICNRILGVNRMLVSDVAGTTIDAVDSPFVYNEKNYTLVDTAGLRKSRRREEDLEIISAFKSQESIRRADLILLMIDGTQGPTDQDARIMQSILEDHKGVIVVANKSDIGGAEIPEYRKTFREQCERVFHFFTDVNIVFTSAKSGQGIDDLFEMIEKVSEQINFRIPTRDMNEFFFETIRKTPAPVWGTTNVKFYYVTQTYQRPPAFIAFANHPDGVTNSYRRFLIKHIKEKWDLHGLPIRIFCMKSRRGANIEE
ncbi:ribosome biogenesis GTPase Der [Bdellovibrio sp. SKB1291214]|uniref:ribosome biogenesis GTPase Der n=1 Tax=Bdellovibrio sp. SKB1291214 TaxID=1732569 RepID=UPI000B519C91|nr:ribosome biogenesis GTPase Der [Bdellovibrio sp. SKB1291214]UYL08074.1 ribosome biogenesis GTPase Der [Bdellovibrio sp. SKB1291214]